MKGFLKNIGKQLANAADNIAYYNVERPQGKGETPDGAAGQKGQEAADPVLEHLMRNLRSKNVRQLFFKHPKSEYAESKDVSMLVGSYNVNGKKPPSGLKLDTWLGKWKDTWPATSTNSAAPDVVAIGFQEIVPLSAGNVFVGLASKNLEAWDRALAVELNGEEWAARHYGTAMASDVASTSAPLAAGPAPDNAVAEALDQKWSGQVSTMAVQNMQGMSVAERIDAVTGGPGNEQLYFQIAAKQMVGIYLSVWVRKSLLPHVKGVQATQVATGFGGYLGNKGAVAVRMFVYDSPLCFVNSHLSSGSKDGDEAKRNADVVEILTRCDFTTAAQGEQFMASHAATVASNMLGSGPWGAMRTVLDNKNVIWMGDLNYRLSGMADEDARKHIRAGHLDLLLESDQLVREMAAGRIFQGWREGPIEFPPTFKFKVGTHTYLGDLPIPAAGSNKSFVHGSGSSFSGSAAAGAGGDDDEGDEGAEGEKQKKRTPAWCDRILWIPGKDLHQLAYGRGETTASDHKPVAAGFLLRSLHYNRKKVEDLLDAARREADMMKAAQRPRPALEPNVVPIGTVNYGEEKVFKVILSNTGPVEGLFHFVPPPSSSESMDDEPLALPAWLTAEPDEGIVQPGASQEITLRICVEGGPHGAAMTLSKATDDFLDAIVILRVEDSSDMFLSVTGNYIKSSWLGLPLDAMAEASASGKVPAQMSTLLAALGSAEALATPGLFVTSVAKVLGDDVEPGPSRHTQRKLLQALAPHCSALEQNQPLPADATPHQIAALLLALLGNLPRPLLPASAAAMVSLATDVAKVHEQTSILGIILGEVLSPVELATLDACFSLLKKVAASTAACISSKALATLLSLYLFPSLSPSAPSDTQAQREALLLLLLE